ncbi:MAG: 4Fe-4S dicluster domain-containing protein [Planctomycetota bacterium]
MCNHCTDAPCVTICPVAALDKRGDGIVDIDRDACIGCRACMQACPYDAIYLNDDLGKVEKCHFCAHRVERGLEPACAVVCPERAIIAGDLDDADSPAGRMIRNGDTRVRRPEQGTGPNVHYQGADEVALEPGAARRPDMYLWSDRPPGRPEAWPISLPLAPDAVTVLDAGHRIEWGWPVAMYLVTKGVAAGAALLAPFAAAFGLTGFAGRYGPEIVALAFTALTCVLLVEDLAHPRLFYRLLTRPNFSSWLVKGGIILSAFAAVLAAAIGLRAGGADAAADALRWAGAALGIAVAGYTAFLFAQCRGRDLWESPLVLPHLLAQALLCGSAALLLLAPASATLKALFAIGALAHLALALAERARRHETANARQAAAFLTSIRLGPIAPFRDGLIAGVGVALVLLPLFPAAAFAPALAGLLLYEHAFIRAGQLPPLS